LLTVATRRRIGPITRAPQASSRGERVDWSGRLPFLIFLFPLALYCLVLAHVNRGRRPILVPGRWDCVGLLFGLSGLLARHLPMLLTRLFDRIFFDVSEHRRRHGDADGLDRLLPADCVRGGAAARARRHKS